MKYNVTIRRTEVWEVTVEAASPEHAKDVADEQPFLATEPDSTEWESAAEEADDA